MAAPASDAYLPGEADLDSDTHRNPSQSPLRKFLALPVNATEGLAAHEYHHAHAFNTALHSSLQFLRKRGQHQHAAGAVPGAVHGAPESSAQSKEILERLKRMDAFDSQDFDPVENDIEREVQINRQQSDYKLEESWRWFLSFLIGMAMGVIAFAVDLAIDNLNTLKYSTVRIVIRGGGFWAPYSIFAVFCVGYASISGWLVAFGAPLAAGSGIPEVKAYLNGIHIRGLLTLKTLVCKLVAVTFSMAAGLIAGKDGPLVHSGAIVGGGISSLGSRTLTRLLRRKVKLPRSCGGYFRTYAEHRDFTLIGTAAGLATAFSAPIGGLLLAIEQGGSFLSLALFWRGFLATCTGVVTLHFLACFKVNPVTAMSSKLGIHRDLGLYADNIAEYGSHYFFYVWETPIFVLIGCAGGCLGAGFIWVNVQMMRWRARYIPGRLVWRRLAEVLVVAFGICTIVTLISYFSPCERLPSDAALDYYEADSQIDDFYAGGVITDRRGLKNFPRLWCKDGEFSRYGQLFFVPLRQQLRLMMHLGETLPPGLDRADLKWDVLLLETTVLYVCALFSFGIGAATGLFAGMLAIGAAGGRLLGMLVSAAVNAGGWNVPISLGAYTVVGAAAMLGGVTRMTLSITVLVMEASGALPLLVPIMLTVFMAKLVGDALGAGVYDTHIKIRGAPVLPEAAMGQHQRMVAEKLDVGELMTTAVVALPPVVIVRALVETLQACAHQAFPVTPDVAAAAHSEEPFELHGVVGRVLLLRLLHHRLGFLPPHSAQTPGTVSHDTLGKLGTNGGAAVPADQAGRLRLLEQLEQIPLKIRPKEDQPQIIAELSEEDYGCSLDLRPFMQRTPYIVHGNASLARTYRLFRTLGLQHLFVGPARPHVLGIITRKDITEETCQLVLGEKAGACGRAPPPPATPHQQLPYEPFHQLPKPHGAHRTFQVMQQVELTAHCGISSAGAAPPPVDEEAGIGPQLDSDSIDGGMASDDEQRTLL